jgi:hypothetical protein
MTHLDHPSSGLPVGIGRFFLDFFPPCFHMGNVSFRKDGFQCRFTAISLSAHKCCSISSRLSKMISSKTSSSWVTSCRFAPVTTSDNGTPRPSIRRCRLVPFFPPVGRIPTNRLPCQRSLHHGSVYALPFPHEKKHILFADKLLVIICNWTNDLSCRGRKWPKRPPPPDRTARTGQVSRSSISD